tara:strand:- start:657575 stop:660655 length:3081 start_codon:yes stop_codon:yes gene_type:complete
VKRLIIGTFLLFFSVVSIAAVLLLSGAISGERIKPYIVDGVRQYAGYQLQVNGAINYQLLPAPHIQVYDIQLQPETPSIAQTEEKTDQPLFVAVEQIDLYISLIDLLKGKIVVDRLKLNQPVIRMQDSKSWETQILSDRLSKSAKSESKAPSSKEGSLYQVRNIEIKGGDLKYGQGSAMQHITDINFKLAQNLLPTHFDTTLSFSLNKEPYSANAKLDIQDLAAKIIGVDGQFSAVNKQAKSSVAGIMSWADGLSYQGELSLDYVLPKQGSTGSDNRLSYKSMVSLAQEVDAKSYALKAQNSQISYGGYKYEVDLEGQVLGKALAQLSFEVVSNLDANVRLKDSVARILGNIDAKNKLTISRDKDINFTSDLKLLDAAYALSYVQEYQKPPRVNLSGKRLDLSSLYKKREVVARDSVSLFDVYLEKGQDHFHDIVMGYIKDLPAMPAGSWHVQLGEIVQAQRKITDFKLDAQTKASGVVRIDGLSATYLDSNQFKVSGLVDATDKSESYDLNLALSINDPQAIATYLPTSKTGVYLDLLGDNGNYNWDGHIDVDGGRLSVKALHKEQLPKDYVSLLTLDFDLKKFSVLSKLPAFQDALRDFNLNGAAQLEARIGLLKDKSVQLDYMRGKVNKTTLDINGKTRFIGQKSEYSVQVKADELHYTPPLKQAATKKTAMMTEWSHKDVKLPVASDLVAAVDFSIDRFYLNKDKIEALTGKLAIANMNLTLSDLSAKAFSGVFTGRSTYKANDARNLDFAVSMQNVNSAALVETINAHKKPSFIEGVLQFDVTGQSAGRSSSALVYGLNGSGKLSGNSITLNGIDLAKIGHTMRIDTKLEQNLRALDDVMNSAMKKGHTVFDKVDLPYKIVSGVVKIDKGLFESADFDLLVNGTIALTNKTVDLRNTITFKGAGSEGMPAVSFTVKGPLNAPAKDFASQIVQEFLKNKISRKLNNALNTVLQDLLKTESPKAAPVAVPAADNDNQITPPESEDVTGGWAEPTEQTQPSKDQDKVLEILDPAQLLLRQILGQ